MMTAYERVLCTIQHRRPDRPPMEIMAAAEAYTALRAHLGVADDEAVRTALGVDFRTFGLPIVKRQRIPETVTRASAAEARLSVSPFGVVLRSEPLFPQAHRIWGPFYDTDDLDAFDWPAPADVAPFDSIAEAVAAMNARGLCTLARCDNPFKWGTFMRPFEAFLMDCIDRPTYVRELIERIAEVEFTRAENGVRAGCRAVMIFGDFADQRSLMVSPGTFRIILKPVLADLVSRVRAIEPETLLFLHSDGNLTDILEDLIEIGFDAVHPIQLECMDMSAVKRTFGDRLTLFGGISVQSELPHSRPGAIRALVRRRVDELGADGGFMLAPTNTLLADCPPESVMAIYEEGARAFFPS